MMFRFSFLRVLSAVSKIPMPEEFEIFSKNSGYGKNALEVF